MTSVRRHTHLKFRKISENITLRNLGEMGLGKTGGHP